MDSRLSERRRGKASAARTKAVASHRITLALSFSNSGCVMVPGRAVACSSRSACTTSLPERPLRFPIRGAADAVDIHEALAHLARLVERLHLDVRAAHGERILHQARDGGVAAAAFAVIAAALPVDPGHRHRARRNSRQDGWCRRARFRRRGHSPARAMAATQTTMAFAGPP